MKLGFAAQFDVQDVRKRSGTPYFMSHNMEKQGIEIEYLCPLKTMYPTGFKLKRFLKQAICHQHESSRWNTEVVKNYGLQLQEKLKKVKVDGVIGHILMPMAYLECEAPLFVWTDVLYASHLGFYPPFDEHSTATIQQANALTRQFLKRCKLAIFSSEWAARGAMEIYGAEKSKIRVVPYGANIVERPRLDFVKTYIAKRSRKVVKLLFMGKPWDRKGGDTVLSVTNALHAAGQPVELNIVGCTPPEGTILPDYVKCHGFISKSTPEGMLKLTDFLTDSHFLFVPTRTEAFGLVFCEANAYGLPCLTSYVGGVPVKDNINGMTFSLDAPISAYCDYIVNIMQDPARYEELALSSFHEYETRLNWDVAVKTVKGMIQDVL